jgi:prepilin-type N-terminal cleavage/methylation domain-containing protein
MKNGFTLLESIIAIFVLTIGIVGVLQMFPISIQTAKLAEMSTVASQLGQEKIEEIISQSYNSLATGTTTENYNEIPGFPAYKRVTAISCVNPSLQEVACNYSPGNDPNPSKKVEVTIFWKSPLGVTEKNFKIATLISKR